MNSHLYKAGIMLTKKTPLTLKGELPDALIHRVETLLCRERVRGVSMAWFSQDKIQCAWGGISKMAGDPVSPDTFFRIASISKFVTAFAAMMLVRQGRLDLSWDISDILHLKVRNPHFPGDKITPFMLLTHTSSLHDGQSYSDALSGGAALDAVLSGDSFSASRPGETWEYSNFGAGIMGSIIECITGLPFDAAMKELVFDPLSILASFYPQNVPQLADAWRLFPPARHPNFDSTARRKKPLPAPIPDPMHHYLSAHGGLCIKAADLARLAVHITGDEAFPRMIAPDIPFGARDKTLSQGIGTFIYRDAGIPIIYGHQGLAYGAVHGLFMDMHGHGFVILTSAASEERHGVLTQMNRGLCQIFFGRDGLWTKSQT